MMAKKTLAESRKDSPKSPKTVKPNQRPARIKKPKKPTDKLADKTLLTRLLQGVFGDAQKKTLRRMYKKTKEIGALEPKYQAMSDQELAAQTDILKEKLAISPSFVKPPSASSECAPLTCS